MNSVLEKLFTLPGYTSDEISKIQERIEKEYQKQRENPQNMEEYLVGYDATEQYSTVEHRQVEEEKQFEETETYKVKEDYIEYETKQVEEQYEVEEKYTAKEPYEETISV